MPKILKISTSAKMIRETIVFENSGQMQRKYTCVFKKIVKAFYWMQLIESTLEDEGKSSFLENFLNRHP
jgi:hypothetical protein